MAHAGGRPTKYNDSFPGALIDYMSKGKSVTQFCALQTISKQTFYDWTRKHSEFSDAYDIGAEKCEAFWETWLKNNIENVKINAMLAKMLFTNRFGWSDKKDVQQDTKTTVTLCDETKRKVRQVFNTET